MKQKNIPVLLLCIILLTSCAPSVTNLAEELSERSSVDIQSVNADISAEESANALPLKEIRVICSLEEDPSSKKYTGKTNIAVWGCVQEEPEYLGFCRGKSNLDGNMSIKLFSLKPDNSVSPWILYSKGNVLLEGNSPIREKFQLRRGYVSSGSAKYYHNEISIELVNASKIQYKYIDEKPDEYGRVYERVPLIVNAVYTDTTGKEYLYNFDNGAIPRTNCELVKEVNFNS